MQNDAVAGISVGFMVVPQGMAYASSAGLPSVFGLYGAFLPCLVYCCLGSSRQLAVGPVAVTSLLFASNLHSLIPCSQAISNPNSPGTPELMECQLQYNQVVSNSSECHAVGSSTMSRRCTAPLRHDSTGAYHLLGASLRRTTEFPTTATISRLAPDLPSLGLHSPYAGDLGHLPGSPSLEPSILQVIQVTSYHVLHLHQRLVPDPPPLDTPSPGDPGHLHRIPYLHGPGSAAHGLDHQVSLPRRHRGVHDGGRHHDWNGPGTVHPSAMQPSALPARPIPMHLPSLLLDPSPGPYTSTMPTAARGVKQDCQP